MNSKEYYNKLAEGYSKYRSAAQWILSPLIDLIDSIDSIDSNQAILEIGCGTGNYINKISIDQRAKCYGLDNSLSMLNKAIRRDSKAAFFAGDANGRCPLKSKSISVAFCVDVIHHIRNVYALFGESFRFLKDQGCFIIITDSTEDIHYRSITKFFPDTISFELARYHTIESLTEVGYRAGFSRIDSISIRQEKEITIETLNVLEQRAFSAFSILTDQQHSEGLNKVRKAMEDGEKWHSCSTILKCQKG